MIRYVLSNIRRIMKPNDMERMKDDYEFRARKVVKFLEAELINARSDLKSDIEVFLKNI